MTIFHDLLDFFTRYYREMILWGMGDDRSAKIDLYEFNEILSTKKFAMKKKTIKNDKLPCNGRSAVRYFPMLNSYSQRRRLNTADD